MVRILPERPSVMCLVSDLIVLARAGESVIDLSARSALRSGSARPARPAVVTWNVCRQCNMSCPSCAASATSRRSAQDLETAEVCAILEQLASGGVRRVVWTGGEPLLRDDLATLVRRTRDLGMLPALSSNGALLADRARALADAGLESVEVTLHAPGRRNDVYRGIAGGFDLAVRGLVAARVSALQTGIRMTVTRTNAAEVVGMLDLAVQLAVDSLHVAEPVCAGRTRRVVGDDLTADERRNVLLRLFDRIASMTDVRPSVVAESNEEVGPLLVRWVAERWGVAAADRVLGALRHRAETTREETLSIDHVGHVRADPSRPSAFMGDLRKESYAAILARLRGPALRAAGPRHAVRVGSG